MSSPMNMASQLAEFAARTPTSAIPDLALERAKMSLASTVASAAMGYHIESATIIRQLELANAGAQHASVWFNRTMLPLPAAVRINAVASDAAASDDSDLRSIAHIGTIASVTAVALGEHTGAIGVDILAAMVLGYEVAGRVDEALTPGRMQRGFHGSVSTVFAAAIAAGRLLKLHVPQMAQAIALAATSIGGMAVSADTSCAREYHAGMAAAAGVQAALAAQHGFSGELTVLERPRGFLAAMDGQALDEITRDLGSSWDIVTDMAIKLMPGAHPFHATAEAAADAARLGNVAVEDIENVEISAAVQWTNFKGSPHPRNLVDAAHSLVYFVAAAIADDGFGWKHMDVAKMADPVIARLQDKVTFDPNPPPLPDRFPHRHGGTVTIRMANGQVFRSTCVAPRGSGQRGVAWEDVRNKYYDLVPLAGLGQDRIDASFALVRELDDGGPVSRLTQLLTPGP
jgi:2-methylcitrate dehydratase PrpD